MRAFVRLASPAIALLDAEGLNLVEASPAFCAALGGRLEFEKPVLKQRWTCRWASAYP